MLSACLSSSVLAVPFSVCVFRVSHNWVVSQDEEKVGKKVLSVETKVCLISDPSPLPLR